MFPPLLGWLCCNSCWSMPENYGFIPFFSFILAEEMRVNLVPVSLLPFLVEFIKVKILGWVFIGKVKLGVWDNWSCFQAICIQIVMMMEGSMANWLTLLFSIPSSKNETINVAQNLKERLMTRHHWKYVLPLGGNIGKITWSRVWMCNLHGGSKSGRT